MFHKIAEVKALRGFLLWVVFRDGAETLYDVSTLFDKIPAFRDFENIPGLFNQVKTDAGGYGVSWNDDLDLDAEELRANGTLLKEAVELSPGCACPTCGQMLRRKSEAQKTASRANLARRKSKGGRPVNPDSKRQRALKKKNAFIIPRRVHP
ncbi:MAG: hypothetical protein BWY31_00847 [Lentisphaerae bacterium ADurb.Bin242]|nr:MAG: hypothetical protein BWY31_00847 [Lentisphaerae bacterium ADurb.Bin242]